MEYIYFVLFNYHKIIVDHYHISLAEGHKLITHKIFVSSSLYIFFYCRLSFYLSKTTVLYNYFIFINSYLQTNFIDFLISFKNL